MGTRDRRMAAAKGSKAVDSYISAAPEEFRGMLETIRSAIKGVAPEAHESISYGIPYYSYKGRLAWFGLYREHIGLYLRPPVIKEHERDLVGYRTTKSAVRLPLNVRVPVRLVRKLVRARARINQAEEESRSGSGS